MQRCCEAAAAASVVAAVAAACGSFDDAHPAAADRMQDAGIAEDAGSDVVAPPVGCDPGADPKDAPKCVVNEYGVFVDGTNGNDASSGTKELPLKTIGAALTKAGSKPRVYVCAGTYAEQVKVTSAVSIYGGFSSGSWGYTGEKAKVVPSARGVALSISNAPSAIVISDLEVVAQDATDPGESSVAMVVASSPKVTLRRVKASAGKGADAADEGAPPTNLFSANVSDLDGNGASGATGGVAKTCACKVHGSSAGARVATAATRRRTATAARRRPRPLSWDSGRARAEPDTTQRRLAVVDSVARTVRLGKSAQVRRS